MRRVILWCAVAGVALVGEWRGFGFGEPADWLPDLAAGLALLGAGAITWERRPELPAGPLLLLAGLAWFAGGVWSVALFWHRGPLIHALLAPRRWGAVPRARVPAIAAGYAAALIVPLGESVAGTFALGLVVALTAAATRDGGRLPALGFGVLLVLLAAARAAGVADDTLLYAYEAAVCAVAVALAATVGTRPWERVTDLVVELAAAPSGTVRDGLARALDDPSLEVGYASPDGFRDARGGLLAPPGPGRSRTVLEQDGVPSAVLVHDAGVLDDPRLVEAISAAARLAAANARLQAEVRAQIAELEASRARLLAVADEERTALQQRLHDGAERRLTRVAGLLEDAGAVAGRPAAVLEAARADLRALAHGLAPADLAASLAALAGASVAPVELDVAAGELDVETSAVAYFVCAEALANASKHATARRVTIHVRADAGRLLVDVADDGRGGADPDGGSGLRGLAERVAACGGQLRVESPRGRGTRVTAGLPLSRSASTASR